MASSLTPEHRARLADIVGRMEAAGEPPENIQTAVEGYKAKYSGGQDAAMGTRAERGNSPGASFLMGRDPFTALGARLTNNNPMSALPGIGGAVGGLAPGPLSIPGAALGGGVGEGVRQGLSGENIDPARIGLEATGQGVAQAAGGLLVKGAKAAAGPLMRSAMGVGKAIGGEVKLGAELFPDPVPEAISRGIAQTPKGALKAKAMRRGVGKEIGELIDAETASGRQFDTKDVVKYAKEMLKDKSLSTEERAKIFNELVSFYKDKGGKMTPALVQSVKRRYAGKWKKWDSGQDPSVGSVGGLFAREISTGAREAINTIGGMPAKNAEYEALKGLEKATYAAARRRGPAWEAQKPGTYPIVRAILNNPGINSKVAIKMADPEFQAALKQSPRAVQELIRQLIYTDQPDATSGQ